LFVKNNSAKIRRDFFAGEVFSYPKMVKEVEKNNIAHSYVLEYQSRMVDAIHQAFIKTSRASNGDEKTKFLKDFFWNKQHRPLYGFCAIHCIHENTGRLWIQQFLDDVARIFGLDF